MAEDIIEQAGRRIVQAQRHAYRCEQVAAGVAALSTVVFVGAIFIALVGTRPEMLSLALVALLVGGSWWAVVRAAGMLLHLKVDAVLIEAEE